ncbi:MAG: ACT domain-containing protein, partial [Sarcina sp.]
MKAVVTVVGKDRSGIIYDVSKILFENSINILDISQTILGGYFTMMMITDISKSTKQIDELKQLFETLILD